MSGGQPFKIPGLGQLPDTSTTTSELAPDVAIALQYALAEKQKLASLAATDRLADSTTAADAQVATPVAGNDDRTRTHDQTNVETNGEKDGGKEEEKGDKHVDSKDVMEIEIDGKATERTTTSPATEAAPTEAAPIEANGDGAHEGDITSTLDAALALEDFPQAAEAEAESEQAEWEVDSDPYQSSSDDSSDDSSDEDSDDDDQQMLGLEETVRLLMAADDNDGDGDGNSRPGRVAAPLRTKNELVEEPLPKPDVTITPEMKIELVGHVMSLVDTTVVVQSLKDGETRVLNNGTVLCKEDRTVISALADTFGPVRDPKYLVIFNKPDEIKELGLERGTPIYYSVVHADYVFTQVLKQEKGTDASNLHDEEVAPEDMEFSDDEKEAAYRKALRSKKKAGKAGRGRDQYLNAEVDQGALNYEEDDDGPYRPLQRPGTFAQGAPSSLPPRPQGYAAARPSWSRGLHRGRGPRGGHRGGHRGGRGGSSNYDGGISAPFPMPQTQQTGQGYQQPIPPPPPQWGGQTPFPVPHVPFPQPPQTRPQQLPSGPFNFGFQGWNQGQQAAPMGPSYIPPPWATPTPGPPPAPAYGNPTFFQGHAHGQQNPEQGQPQARWPNGQSPT